MSLVFPTFLDETPNYASDPKNYQTIRAKLVLSLIFNDGLIFSDSQILTGRNSRRLLGNDNMFRELLINKEIKIAIRDRFYNENESNNLVLAEKKFDVDEKIAWATNKIDTNILTTLESYNNFVTWDVNHVSKHYTQNSISILATSKINQKLKTKIHDLCSEYILKNGSLDRSFIHYKILNNTELLGKGLPKSDILKIKKIFDAPYYTAMPTITKSNPIYTQKIQETMKVMRRVDYTFETVNVSEMKSRITSYKIFQSGINCLSYEDLKKIKESSALIEFNRFRYNMNQESDLNQLNSLFLNVITKIERTFLTKFPHLLRDSTQEKVARIVNQVAVERDTQKNIVDIIKTGIEFVQPSLNFLGLNSGGMFSVLTDYLEALAIDKIEKFELQRLETLNANAENRDNALIAGHRASLEKFKNQFGLNEIKELRVSDYLEDSKILNTSSFDQEYIF